jgi:hypothetical protein
MLRGPHTGVYGPLFVVVMVVEHERTDTLDLGDIVQPMYHKYLLLKLCLAALSMLHNIVIFVHQIMPNMVPSGGPRISGVQHGPRKTSKTSMFVCVCVCVCVDRLRETFHNKSVPVLKSSAVHDLCHVTCEYFKIR